MKKIVLVFLFWCILTVAFIVNLKSGSSVLESANGSADSVDISGVIEFKKINLSFKNGGKITNINFDEGFHVNKGDVVAKLDTAELSAQKIKLENALAYSQSLAAQLETMIEYGKLNQKSQAMVAAANLMAAKARLDEALAGNREQQVEQAKALLNRARIERDKLEKDYKRYSELIKTGATSTQNLDMVKTQYLAAEQQMVSAQEQYNLLKEGSRKETIELMKAGVEQANAQIMGAEALNFQVKKTQNELESLKKDIEVKKADIDLINIKIADSTLCSPEAGVILEKFSETSEVVGAAAPVGVLANMVDVWVRGYIPEEDLGRIKIGQAVDIISDTYPDKRYKGYVAFISSEAEFTPKNVQTKRERVKLVYRVKINVDNSSGELKLGMPVDAKIKL